jgi:hypothetical protein
MLGRLTLESLMKILEVTTIAMCMSAAAWARAAPVTFSREIAPLVYKNCTTCHRSGEAAPFPLISYGDAKKHARQIADVTARHIMPPWRAEPGHGDFIGEHRLDDSQIALFKKWVDQGCLEGDAKAAPEVPQFTSGWQLGEPDMIVKMPEPYELVAEGRDVYRCFVLPVQIPAGKYLRAVEFRPSNRRIVHHALLTTLRHDFAVARLFMGKGNSFSSGLVAPGDRLAGSLGLWTPGYEPRPLPAGYAIEWPRNCDLVVQLHLHPSGKPEFEQSSIGLYFSGERPHGRLKSLVMLYKDINIAPGNDHYSVNKSMTLKEDVDAYGIFPHMHLIGRTVDVTATLPDGSKQPLIQINDWDFNWQNYYQYAKPIHLKAGTKVEAHWTFDNSADNAANPSQPPQRVTFGEQTTDEMAALIFDVIPRKTPAVGASASIK